jgi:O-antigen ligase
MPNAHSGYFDTALEMGYVGLSILLIFVFTTVHATGQLIDRAPVRGWIVTTMMFFLIVTNFLESMWMRGFEFPWLVFLLLAAVVGRCKNWQQPAVVRVQATPVPAIEGQRRTRGRRTIPTRNNQPRRPNIACNNVPNPNIG